MQRRYLKKHTRGFTLLFSVLISGLVLAVGIGIFNIVYRELQLSTLTRDSDTALYAADAGIECGLFWEFKGLDQNPQVYFDPLAPAQQTIECGGETIDVEVLSADPSATSTWGFNLPVGEVTASGQSCAVVTISKHATTFRTSINSSGRNEGGENDCTPGDRTVERTLEVNF